MLVILCQVLNADATSKTYNANLITVRKSHQHINILSSKLSSML